MSTKKEKQFIIIPLEGETTEELPDFRTKISDVCVNKNHIVSAQFNTVNCSLVIVTTTVIGHGATKFRWEQQGKVSKDPRTKKLSVLPDPDRLVEKAYDFMEIEPAAITVTDRNAIERIWTELNPGESFTGFEEHEALVNKISQLKSEKEKELQKKAEIDKLHLTKVDGSPLNSDTVEKPIILNSEGDIANED